MLTFVISYNHEDYNKETTCNGGGNIEMPQLLPQVIMLRVHKCV